MKVLIVEPLKVPYEKEISGDLKSMQAVVGGLIQAIYPFDDPELALVCNDEGKILDSHTTALCGMRMGGFTT